MRKTRKGFSLVELLIVVAILGVLAAVMTVSSTSSIAKAKASTIANNLRVCTAGAQVYYLTSGDLDGTDDAISSVTTTKVLNDTVPSWSEFSGDSDTIKYSVVDSPTGPSNWAVTVKLTGNDASDIAKALTKIKGFKSVNNATEFTYKLFKGKVESSS